MDQAAGFSLVEIMMVVAMISIAAAAATPSIAAAMRIYTINSATESVASTVRSARYSAVTANRPVRVRFNCPSAGRFRVVELVGTAIDNDTNRCQLTNYPYPDPDASAAPNVDGPVVVLPAGTVFNSAQDLEISAAGRVTPLSGCPTCVLGAPPSTLTIGNGNDIRTITVSASGQVQVQ